MTDAAGYCANRYRAKDPSRGHVSICNNWYTLRKYEILFWVHTISDEDQNIGDSLSRIRKMSL